MNMSYSGSQRRKPKKKATTGKTLLVIFILALLSAAVIVGALIASGFRVVVQENGAGEEVKFFGMTDRGVPQKGLVFYPDGVRADLDAAKKTIKFKDGSTYTGDI